MLKVYIGFGETEAYCPISGKSCNPFCSLLSNKATLGWRVCLMGNSREHYGSPGLRIVEVNKEEQ